MSLSSFRKLDYIIFYTIIVFVFIIQLFEVTFGLVAGILVCATIPALILGTITNLLFKNK